MAKPMIVAYLKTRCSWSEGVRAVLSKYDLPFDERNVQTDSRNFTEMIQRSGQQMSPCVVVNGEMLRNVSGGEVEQFLIERKLVAQTAPGEAETGAGAL